MGERRAKAKLRWGSVLLGMGRGLFVAHGVIIDPLYPDPR